MLSAWPEITNSSMLEISRCMVLVNFYNNTIIDSNSACKTDQLGMDLARHEGMGQQMCQK